MPKCPDCPHEYFEHWKSSPDQEYFICQVAECECRGLHLTKQESMSGKNVVSTVTTVNIESKLDKIIELVFEDSNKAKLSQQYQVADLLATQAIFFQYGRISKLPHEWKDYSDKIDRLEEKEYQLYLQLKKKFETRLK